MVTSIWKQDRIKKLWREGWSIGAICDKANVSKEMVYRYNGEKGLIKNDRKKRTIPDGYFPPALQKRLDEENQKNARLRNVA